MYYTANFYGIYPLIFDHLVFWLSLKQIEYWACWRIDIYRVCDTKLSILHLKCFIIKEILRLKFIWKWRNFLKWFKVWDLYRTSLEKRRTRGNLIYKIYKNKKWTWKHFNGVLLVMIISIIWTNILWKVWLDRIF